MAIPDLRSECVCRLAEENGDSEVRWDFKLARLAPQIIDRPQSEQVAIALVPIAFRTPRSEAIAKRGLRAAFSRETTSSTTRMP
jgi:hypothetical protein